MSWDPVNNIEVFILKKIYDQESITVEKIYRHAYFHANFLNEACQNGSYVMFF